MNQIAKMSETIPQPASESAVWIALIERMVRDPSVDVDRVERMLAARERIKADEARCRFDEAMSATQGEMTRVSADSSNPQTKSRYASYGALDRALRPHYSKHGFRVSFNTLDTAPENYVRVVAYVTCGGHRETYQIDMPADGKGAKGGDVMTKTHATMSAVTYARRGLLRMIFNIAEGDDDDGNAAGRRTASNTVSAAQIAELQQLIMDAGIDIQSFYDRAHISQLEELPELHFAGAKKWISDRKKANERDRPAFS